jgi:hypothetical protein
MSNVGLSSTIAPRCWSMPIMLLNLHRYLRWAARASNSSLRPTQNRTGCKRPKFLAHFRALAADLPERRGVVVGSTELEYRTFGRKSLCGPATRSIGRRLRRLSYRRRSSATVLENDLERAPELDQGRPLIIGQYEVDDRVVSGVKSRNPAVLRTAQCQNSRCWRTCLCVSFIRARGIPDLRRGCVEHHPSSPPRMLRCGQGLADVGL